MTYKTLLVHLQAGSSNSALLDVAGRFADRFNADVIGIAACQPMMMAVSAKGMVCDEVYVDEQRQITADLDRAQGEFRDALRSHTTSLEWRSATTLAPPADYLSMHARSADLVLTGSPIDRARAGDPGSLVMEAGRPVYLVPANGQATLFHDALVAWNDTRECRRAVADALPLLQQTERITVLEIAALDDLDAAQSKVDDVVRWLERHGLKAAGRVERSNGNDRDQLNAAAEAANADVIVAGAYGHSRLREWVMGGVTRDLLLECARGVLLSR